MEGSCVAAAARLFYESPNDNVTTAGCGGGDDNFAQRDVHSWFEKPLKLPDSVAANAQAGGKFRV